MKWDQVASERTEDVRADARPGDTGFRQIAAVLLIAGAAIVALAVLFLLVHV